MPAKAALRWLSHAHTTPQCAAAAPAAPAAASSAPGEGCSQLLRFSSCPLLPIRRGGPVPIPILLLPIHAQTDARAGARCHSSKGSPQVAVPHIHHPAVRDRSTRRGEQRAERRGRCRGGSGERVVRDRGGDEREGRRREQQLRLEAHLAGEGREKSAEEPDEAGGALGRGVRQAALRGGGGGSGGGCRGDGAENDAEGAAQQQGRELEGEAAGKGAGGWGEKGREGDEKVSVKVTAVVEMGPKTTPRAQHSSRVASLKEKLRGRVAGGWGESE